MILDEMAYAKDEREYTEDDLDLSDIVEPPVVKPMRMRHLSPPSPPPPPPPKPTNEIVEDAVLLHARYDVSIKELCKQLCISRDKYYSILKKIGLPHGKVDYKELVTHEEW